MRDLAHSSDDVWYDSSTSVTCLIHVCDVTHLYVWHHPNDVPLIHARETTITHVRWCHIIRTRIAILDHGTSTPAYWGLDQLPLALAQNSHPRLHDYHICWCHVITSSGTWSNIILQHHLTRASDRRLVETTWTTRPLTESFIRVTRPTHTCDTTHSYVWHVACAYVTRIMHMCDMTHSYVWHDSFALDLEETPAEAHQRNLSDSCIRVTRLTHKCDMTH